MNKQKVIIQNIPQGDSQYEYSIDDNSSLTLVLIMTHSSSITAGVHLNGRGAHARIVGLAVGKDNTSIKLHTDQFHEAPETTSNLLVKGVFGGHATFLYDGAIVVKKNAQKTDAYQRNENLLLSPDAFVESKPSLEILANDVRCTHAAATSALPDDQLWYLATRGIKGVQAQNLLVRGFIESALAHIDDIKIRKRVLQRVLDTL